MLFTFGCSGSYVESSVPISEGFYIDLSIRVWLCAPNECGTIQDGWDGAAAPGGLIWVYGYVLPNGKITTDKWVLGHELQHIMNWNDNRIAHPDNEE